MEFQRSKLIVRSVNSIHDFFKFDLNRIAARLFFCLERIVLVTVKKSQKIFKISYENLRSTFKAVPAFLPSFSILFIFGLKLTKFKLKCNIYCDHFYVLKEEIWDQASFNLNTDIHKDCALFIQTSFNLDTDIHKDYTLFIYNIQLLKN